MADTFFAQQRGESRHGATGAVDSQLLARSTFFNRAGRRLQDSDEFLLIGGMYAAGRKSYEYYNQDEIEKINFHKLPLL
jgi:hypothetical protein